MGVIGLVAKFANRDDADMTHSQREFATEIVRKLRDAGFLAYFAGGCVRDLLLNRPAKDYDVATSAKPAEVRQLFGQRRTLAVGESFGVIIVLGPKAAGQVEVATFRTDLEYTDGRRPDGVVFCTPDEDAQRRDFTINGMFYDPIDSRVLDYVNGEADLAAGVVRAIRDPHERMREDKLRMLRAVRFAATLDFQLDPVTANAVREMAGEITVVSVERIAQELKKMLVDRHRVRAIALCGELGLLAVILPELFATPASGGHQPPEWSHRLHSISLDHPTRIQGVDTPRSLLALLREPSFELAFAALLLPLSSKTVMTICRRLKLSNDETDRITWLVEQQHALDQAATLSLAPLKRLLAHRYRDDLLKLTHARLLAADADLHPVLFVEEFLLQTPPEVLNPPPLISGDDLVALGYRPGPRFREWLETVRDAQLNLEIVSRDEALALVRQLQAVEPDGKP